MYRLQAGVLLACFSAIATASHDAEVCSSIWVTKWGNDGEQCAEYYATETDTYTLAMPYQTTNYQSMTGPPPSPGPPGTATTPDSSSPTNPIIGALCSSTNKCPDGKCCGKYGYCGSTVDYCGADCQPDAGICWSASSMSDMPPPASIPGSMLPSSTPGGIPPTTNGHCGTNGATCLGWPLGECCSQYDTCGSTPEYCGTGCHAEFGLCGLSSSIIPPPSTLSTSIIHPPSGVPTTSTVPPPPGPPSTTTDVVIPSASPTWSPCTALADFYVDALRLGGYYHACGQYGVCQNVDPWFVNAASSLYFLGQTSYCDLYASADCGPGLELTVNVNDAIAADFTLPLPSFNDKLVSFKCYNYD